MSDICKNKMCVENKDYCICDEVDFDDHEMNIYVFKPRGGYLKFLPECTNVKLKLTGESDIELVNRNGLLLKFIKNQTLCICLSAVNNNNKKAICFIINTKFRKLIKKILKCE